MPTIEKVAGIFRTENVCFPRSGHHALKDVLADYFEDDFHYCELYLEPQKNLEVCAATNYQKQHDFDLSTPVKTDRRYIVQVRNPIAAIQSWMDLDVRTGERAPFEYHEAWHAEFVNRLRFWKEFVEKWYVQRIERRFIIQYERLVARPRPTCISVIQFLTGIQNVDMPKLEASLRKFPIVARPEREVFWAPQA